MQSLHKVVSQGRIHGLGIVLGLPFGFVDSHELFPAPRVFAEAVVGDAIEPGGETRFAPEAANMFVSAQKCLLREIVGQRHIGARELAEQTSHGRLMAPDQFREGVVIVIEEDSGDEVCIRQLHAPRLGQRGNVVFLSFELPDQQVTGADQERNQANAPGAAFPVIDRGQK